MPVPPIAYYDFNAGLGDAMGGPSAEFYERDGRAKTAAAATPAPATGVEGGALAFDGDGQFAYVPHSQALEVQNGTIALWVNPDSLDDERVFVSKDERDTDEGGHFYVGLNDGRLQVRVAPGDGGGNVAWRSLEEVFEPGQWTHVAVSFGADGVHLYINGARLEASALERIEGRIDDPAEYLEAHLLTNDKPLVLGGATRATKDTSSPEAIAQTGPTWMYDGDIDGFGIWGGTRPEDALSASQIAQLAAGAAAPTTPLPPTPVDRTDDDLTGGDGADALDGGFGDDVLRGGAGIDDLKGGYDDDRLYGGDDDDVLNGGRGSDFLDAGAGNDLIILGADGGEPIVAQVYDPAIDDPDDEVNDLWQTVNPGQPMIGDDIALGGDGADVFLIQPALNAKRDILLKHQNADRTIDWKRVAGENGEVHDHWPESVGTDWIVDFDPTEGDVILIDGHTADIERKGSVDHRDVNGDGVMDTVLTIRSNQPNGGAHDKDLMGKVVVLSHRLDAGDVEVNAKSFAGIIDTVEELDEALFAEGVQDDDPDREASINPFLDLLPGDVAALAAPATPVYEETIRARALVDAPDDDVDGTNGDDVLHGDAPAGGHGHGGHGGHGAHGAMAGMPMPMPAPISFFSFEDFEDGVFADGRGVSDLGYYEAKDRAALLQTDLADVPTEAGSPGDGGRAIRFEDDDQFAVVAHDEAYETLQGTVALWFKPDAVDGHPQTLVAKDERNAGEGGHMRIEIRDGGKLLVRLSPGDGGGNREWLSHFNLAEAGEWAHVAVSWGETGATVFWNGEALNDRDFMALQGHTPLSGYKEHFQMENTRAWVLGADTGHANDADSAATLAADDRLRSEFEGAIDGFGVWGGLSAADALSAAQVKQLYENGPGDLSRAARQDAPVEVGDDDLRGWGGDDDLYGGAGRDVLDGGDGNDGLFGGYGADLGLGGAGRDLIELGHGNDTGYGGDGNDVLLSRGYGREGPVYFDADRDEGDPYAELSPVNGQVYESQPIPDDDHYWGGAGADTLRIETLINAKERFLLDHVMEDGHIHWHGVAGENDNVHDHWVDRFGHDVWWDYDEDEGDRIQIVGHTTRVLEVEQIHDEGTGERLFSRIHVYSDQGKNGGAHNDDRLGILDVYGSEVSEKDIYENAGPAYGIVHSIHELEEAVTPLYASDETARQGLRAAGAPQEMAEAPEPAPMPMPMPMPEPAPMPMPAPMAMPPSAEEPTPPQPAPQPAPPAPSAEAEEEEAALPPSPPPSSPPPAPEGPEAPRKTVEIALAADPDDDADLRGDRAGDAMAGAEGDDKLRGRGGDDDLFGGDGDDALRGDRGADRLYGGEGEDRLKGGAGDDFLFGGLDDDRLAGGSRADALFGGEDDDDLKGGGGGDLLVGGLGEDDLIGGGGLDVAVFEGAMEDYAVSVARRRRVEIESFETGEIDALRGVEQIRFLGSGVTYSVARRGLEEMTGDGAFDQAAYDRLAEMAETEFLFVDGAGDPIFG